jgi:hypothetical protein
MTVISATLRQTWSSTMKFSKIVGAAVWMTVSTAAIAQTGGGYPASPCMALSAAQGQMVPFVTVGSPSIAQTRQRD